MATSGKKGKKNKGKAVPLQTFLGNGIASPGTTQVAKKVRNRGDESDEEENSFPQIIQLPTAPRASRMYEDGMVPHISPFLAYISNLPYDVKDDDIYDFFANSEIKSLRLPREDGESSRLRGFGYVEFATRDELINAFRMPDPQIKNRRIKIEISSENDQQKRGGSNRSRYDGFGSSDSRDSTNWRRGTDGQIDADRRSGYGHNRDKQRDGSQETNGSWRINDRFATDLSPRRGGEGFRDRFGGRGHKSNDDYRKQGDVRQERPKLNLKPRTLPLPEIITQYVEDAEKSDGVENLVTPEPVRQKAVGITSEKVFGSARPVDTSAREKEIEDRLEKEHKEKLKLLEEREIEKAIDKEKQVDEKIFEQTEKEEKEDRNAVSWRRRDEDNGKDKGGLNNHRDITPARKNDDRRGTNVRENRESGRDRRDYNRGYERDNRYRERHNQPRIDRERDQYNRDPNNTNKDNKNIIRDSKQRDDKAKREHRQDRSIPKYQSPQGGPVLFTSNKFSAFLDEEDA